MTEAGELWIDNVVYKEEKNWPDDAERKAVRLGLRAFVALVNERAQAQCTELVAHPRLRPCCEHLGLAFDETIRELLGE